MKKTSIGYARKSIQVRGLENEQESVMYQLNEIEEYAKDRDLQLLNIFSDIGYSGVFKSRPELNNMLDTLKEHQKENGQKVDYLIFYNQERLARDLAASIELIMEITELVHEVIFVADGVTSEVKTFRENFLINAARAAENRTALLNKLRQGRRAKIVYRNTYRSTFKPLGYVQPEKKSYAYRRPSTRQRI
ncbi:recombinase family protein [Cytobacillus firmus]